VISDYYFSSLKTSPQDEVELVLVLPTLEPLLTLFPDLPVS